MGRHSRVWNGGFQAFTARPPMQTLPHSCFMQTTPYSPSNHYAFLSTYTSQIPTGRHCHHALCRLDTLYVFLSTYTSRISRWEALQGLEWWLAGLYGAPCRKPLAPPMQTSPLALYADKTPNFFLNSYVFLSSLAPTLPGFRWGGTPRSGMVVSRPLRRGLPETPSTPQCTPCHSSISFRLDTLLALQPFI